jgi:FkbM family methyltransferase
MSTNLSQLFFWTLSYISRYFGLEGRPSRIYNFLAKAGFKKPELKWHRDKWGNEMLLSPYYSIDRKIISAGHYDNALNNLIENIIKPGSICMDIGANIGHITLHIARKVAPSGLVFAFEPAPNIFYKLQQNIQRNNLEGLIIANQLALSNNNSTTLLAYPNDFAENQGLGSIVNINNELVKKKLIIHTKTIDSFVQENSIKKLDFLKIDIQGAEILLLEGGIKTFTVFSPDLAIEISPTDLKCFNKNSKDLTKILSEYKYNIFEINTNGSIGKRIDFNKISSDFNATNIYCTKKIN